MTITIVTDEIFGTTETLELHITHDGDKYTWWTGDDDTCRYTTNNDGEGIFFVNSAKNERRQLVGTCDWRICGTDKATRAKIKRWMES